METYWLPQRTWRISVRSAAPSPVHRIRNLLLPSFTECSLAQSKSTLISFMITRLKVCVALAHC